MMKPFGISQFIWFATINLVFKVEKGWFDNNNDYNYFLSYLYYSLKFSSSVYVLSSLFISKEVCPHLKFITF